MFDFNLKPWQKDLINNLNRTKRLPVDGRQKSDIERPVFRITVEDGLDRRSFTIRDYEKASENDRLFVKEKLQDIVKDVVNLLKSIYDYIPKEQKKQIAMFVIKYIIKLITRKVNK